MALGITIHQSVQGDSAAGRADRGLGTPGPGEPQLRQPRAVGRDPDVEIAWTKRCRSSWDESGWTLLLPGRRGQGCCWLRRKPRPTGKS